MAVLTSTPDVLLPSYLALERPHLIWEEVSHSYTKAAAEGDVVVVLEHACDEVFATSRALRVELGAHQYRRRQWHGRGEVQVKVRRGPAVARGKDHPTAHVHQGCSQGASFFQGCKDELLRHMTPLPSSPAIDAPSPPRMGVASDDTKTFDRDRLRKATHTHN
eukprot:COSAG01_NODE_77_length_28297_cov_104.096230_21_plen_163_part_00